MTKDILVKLIDEQYEKLITGPKTEEAVTEPAEQQPAAVDEDPETEVKEDEAPAEPTTVEKYVVLTGMNQIAAYLDEETGELKDDLPQTVINYLAFNIPGASASAWNDEYLAAYAEVDKEEEKGEDASEDTGADEDGGEDTTKDDETTTTPPTVDPTPEPVEQEEDETTPTTTEAPVTEEEQAGVDPNSEVTPVTL